MQENQHNLMVTFCSHLLHFNDISKSDIVSAVRGVATDYLFAYAIGAVIGIVVKKYTS